MDVQRKDEQDLLLVSLCVQIHKCQGTMSVHLRRVHSEAFVLLQSSQKVQRNTTAHISTHSTSEKSHFSLFCSLQ